MTFIADSLAPGQREFQAAQASKALDRQTDASIDNLVRALVHGNLAARCHAAQALGALRGAAAAASMPLAVQATKDIDAFVRLRAAEALYLIGPIAAPCAATLSAALRDNDRRVRIATCEALGSMGSRAAPGSAEQLALALSDPHWRVRWHAAAALGAMGNQSSRTIADALANRRDDEDKR